MIILFLIILVGSSVYYDFSRNKPKISIYSLEKINQSCSLNLPQEPTIILRMDDVRAYSVPTKHLVDEIIKQNISVTLGVIPRDLEKDKNLQNYLIKIKENIEIAQHGTDHNESDIQITEEKLLEGNKKIQEILRIKPVTYISPYNNISEDSKKIIADYFYIMSANQGILKINKIPEIGDTISTYSYSTKQIVPKEEIIWKCQEDLEKKNLCIITIHPQEYSYDINNARTLSPSRLNDFKEMLGSLKELNASFSTFKELIVCN